MKLCALLIATICLLGLLSTSVAIPITFQVRMVYKIELGDFDPVMDFCDLAGTFNAWGGDPLTPLSDDNEDTIYEITLTGFTPGDHVEFKFRINGQWDGSEEFPGGGANREYTVLAGENSILVWYNNEVPDSGPPIAGFEAHPSKLRAGGLVAFENLSAGAITNWQWTFEGGSPGSSTERDPYVSYPVAGIFDVDLVVSDGTISDTLQVQDAIEVSDLGLEELSWWNDAVFYELFVRSFYDSDGDGIGDFQGIIQKLDYLNDGDPETSDDLGITGIWLMPIHDSPSYHGYDAVDYRSINPDYGNMADFQAFLAAAHARGIRVIIDYVMNHCSSNHPWFQASAAEDPEFRDYFTWSSYDPGQGGPWGQQVWHWNSSGYYYGLFSGAMPDLNYDTTAVKSAMFDAAEFWLDDIGVDGFRLDAVLYIHEDGDQLQNTEETFQFWQDYNQHVKSVEPDALSVGEAWTNTNTILNYVVDDRLDFCFEFDLSYATVGAANDGNASWLSFKAQEVYSVYPYLQFGTFLTNHDQDRVLSVLGENEDKAKVAAGIYLTLPGVPFLYYGEEIGMVGAGPHEIIRRPMQWTDGLHAGFSTGNPWTNINDNYEDYNVLVEGADPASLLNWYKELIAVRNNSPALRQGEYFPVACSVDPVLSFLRRQDEQVLLVMANTGNYTAGNFSLTSYGNSLPPGNYSLANLLDSSDILEIEVSANYEISGLSLAPYQVAIYEVQSSSGTDPEDETPSFKLGLKPNFPNPFNPSTTISYTLPSRTPVVLRVFDVTGHEKAVIHEGVQDAGAYEISWTGRDAMGRALCAGVYLMRLDAGGQSRAGKMILLK